MTTQSSPFHALLAPYLSRGSLGRQELDTCSAPPYACYNTASKKRKLTPTPAFDTLDTAYHVSDITVIENEDSHTSASRSSTKVFANHLHSDHQHPAEASTLPGTASGARDLGTATVVAVGSPSDAYAGLSIEPSEGPGGMIQGQEDPLSLASDDEQVADSASTKTQRDVRSSSPAKRRASAMEDSSMNGAGPASTNGTASTSSKTSSKQHTREASVDMLTTNGNSGAPSTAPSSVPEADEEMEDAQEELPSIDEQVNIIMKEMTVELEDDMVGYAVASGWINRILARSSNKNDHGPYDKNILEGEVGPIDNSSIFPDREYKRPEHGMQRSDM